MRTQNSINHSEYLSPISDFLSVRDVLSIVEYMEQGNREAAREVILDQAGYINAVFADFLREFDKNS